MEAATSVDFLQNNVAAEDFVIYASLPHVYIQAVLVPFRKLKNIEASQPIDTSVVSRTQYSLLE